MMRPLGRALGLVMIAWGLLLLGVVTALLLSPLRDTRAPAPTAPPTPTVVLPGLPPSATAAQTPGPAPATATALPAPAGPATPARPPTAVIASSPLPPTNTAPPAPTLGPPSTTPAGLDVRFTPDLAAGALEPGALLHARVTVPDRQGGSLPTVLGVTLELQDSAGRPAITGGGPAPALPLLEMAPTVWEADLSAPTVPGVYQPRLTIRRTDQPTQILSLPGIALTVAPPRTALLTGLAYTRDGNLWLAASDGKRTRALTFYNPAVEQASDPAWAPDGARLAYTHRLPAPADQVPGSEIWSLAPEGGAPQPLVTRPPGANLLAPAWTPDGAQLLVTVDRMADPSGGGTPPADLAPVDESWDIDEVDLSSGAQQTLFANAAQPDVSVDGQQVVYLAVDPVPAGSVAATPQRLMLARLDAADPQPRRLLPGDPYQTLSSPRISPDGRWVAFAAPNPGGWEGDDAPWFLGLAAPVGANGVPWDVYLVPVAGGEARRLTHFQTDGPGLAWSPNSRNLAVLAETGLYMVGLDGTVGKPIAPGTVHSTLSWYAP